MSLAGVALVGAAVFGYAFLTRNRRNPDFYTDSRGVIRPIRATTTYNEEAGGDRSPRPDRRAGVTDQQRDTRRRKRIRGQQKRRKAGYAEHVQNQARDKVTDRWLDAGVAAMQAEEQVGSASDETDAAYRTILALPAINESACLSEVIDQLDDGKLTPRQALRRCPPVGKQQQAAKALADRWRQGREAQDDYEDQVVRAATDLQEEESRLEVRDARKYPYRSPLSGLAWNQIEYLYETAKARGELQGHVTLEDDSWWQALDFGDEDPFLSKAERQRRRRLVKQKKMAPAITMYGRPRTEANLPPAEPDPKQEIKQSITLIKREIRDLDKKHQRQERAFNRLERLIGQVQSRKLTPVQALKRAKASKRTKAKAA